MINFFFLSFGFLLPIWMGLENAPHKNRGPVYENLVVSGICPQNRQTLTAPDSYLEKVNPTPHTSDTLASGAKLYHKDAEPIACRLCHGIRGNGNGKLAPNMEPPPRNFACYETMKSLPDGQLFWVIKNGSKGTKMPIHKETLTDYQIWQLIRFIRLFGIG